jgi:hypothetical protein
MILQGETIHEHTVLTEALTALVEKGYSKLSIVDSTDTTALVQAREWDAKIDTAKSMLRELQLKYNGSGEGSNKIH